MTGDKFARKEVLELALMDQLESSIVSDWLCFLEYRKISVASTSHGPSAQLSQQLNRRQLH
jgi:hypothetical protein